MLKRVLTALLITGFVTVAAYAAPPAPTVVFIGDQFTNEWANTPGAFPANWVNAGWTGFPGTTPCPAECFFGTSGATMERFKSQVLAVHPAVVHIMVGVDDADIDTTEFQVASTGDYLSAIQTMVDWAHDAGIHVILGLEPIGWAAQQTYDLDAINYLTVAYANQMGTTVVNYNAALTNSPFGYQTPIRVNGYQYDDPTPSGYLLMSQMAAAAINEISNKTETGGYLQDVQLPNPTLQIGTTANWVNVNTVVTGAIVQFTPYAEFSGMPAQPQLNADYGTGATGTWASSNPQVMSVSKTGLSYGLTPGNAIITYVSPSGVRFNEWKMTVSATP